MDRFITVELRRFSICLAVIDGFLLPSFPYEGASFELGYRKTHSLHWCKEEGSGSVSAKVALLEAR